MGAEPSQKKEHMNNCLPKLLRLGVVLVYRFVPLMPVTSLSSRKVDQFSTGSAITFDGKPIRRQGTSTFPPVLVLSDIVSIPQCAACPT